MKYLVMECFDSYAVLLDEDGRFVKSANLGYEVGDTIENPVLMRDKPLEKEPRTLPKKLITGIVAIAAIVTLFFGYNFYQNNFIPYSSIFMAINPEVEMVLNRNGEVLEVDGANEDGVALIQGYEPTSDDKVEVANELVDRAIEMGFLAEGGQISFAIDTPDQVLFQEYGIELREQVDGRMSITIEITDINNQSNQEEPTPDSEPEAESESTQEPEARPEPEPTPAPEPETEPEPDSAPESEEPQMISLEQAKQIAFNHAGVSGANAEFDDEDLESDDGTTYYELEFEIGEDEYKYEIHAYTGQVLDYEIDIDDDDDD
jgi:uncharacterized membrane protein YkoI